MTQEHGSPALPVLCWPSAGTLSTARLASDISSGLSLSRVSSEARCSRRMLEPVISGGSQYLLELKITPTCVRREARGMAAEVVDKTNLHYL